MAVANFWTKVGTAVIVLSIALGLYWAQAISVWNRKNALQTDAMGLDVMVGWAVLAAKFLGRLLYVLMFLLCSYWFLFSKVLTDYVVLVPTDSYSVGVYYACLAAGIICSSVTTTHAVYTQCTSDIIFVEWERSKREDVKVSVWRKIMVAREWFNLQYHRSVSIVIGLVVMLLFEVGLQWHYVATLTPTTEVNVNGIVSPILLFCTCGFVWLITMLCQLVFKMLVVNNVSGDDLLNFVDKLSLANISLFIMDAPFHGYYIHGKSVHPLADTDMQELKSYLAKEQDNSVA